METPNPSCCIKAKLVVLDLALARPLAKRRMAGIGDNGLRAMTNLVISFALTR